MPSSTDSAAPAPLPAAPLLQHAIGRSDFQCSCANTWPLCPQRAPNPQSSDDASSIELLQLVGSACTWLISATYPLALTPTACSVLRTHLVLAIRSAARTPAHAIVPGLAPPSS
eukprot:3267235-Pleurochrysis_carterae.AAC.1